MRLLQILTVLLCTGSVASVTAEGAFTADQAFGAPMPTDVPALSLSEAIAQLESGAESMVKVQGQVTEVCQAKGCWMILVDGDQYARITFEDYGFFVPIETSMQRSVVYGVLSEHVLSGQEADHFAQVTELAITYGTKILAGLATLVIGLYVVSLIMSAIRKMFEKSGVDPSLRSFLASLISILLTVIVYITALGMLGVEMTSFIAILGAAGLAVGLALSGTLQNFAGGVMILFFKPYKVGDFIEAQGYMGTVKEIQIFVTILTTPDNKTVLIPNGPLATDSMINFSTQATGPSGFLTGMMSTRPTKC